MATSTSPFTLLRLPMSPPVPAGAAPTTTMTRRRTRPLRAACAYALQEGQSRRSHRLPCGLDLEVIAQQPPTPAPTPGRSERPPLVFLHGSFHAAWCWAEHWLPFFSRAGFSCFALSLRAQGESSIPSEAVAATLEWIRACDSQRYSVQLKPASFRSYHGTCAGSSNHKENRKKKASTAPYGIEVTLSLAAKAYANSLPLCKETFFSSQMDDELVLRYQGLMKDSSKLPLFDLRKLNASLPVPSTANGTLEVLVMGASNDFIVDAEGLSETARFYNVQPVCVEGVAHDMMLDCSWEKGAKIILSWLDKLGPRSA
ncbi:hypothetical protein ACQ4PT_017931 [Festuca glaucescens]